MRTNNDCEIYFLIYVLSAIGSSPADFPLSITGAVLSVPDILLTDLLIGFPSSGPVPKYGVNSHIGL